MFLPRTLLFLSVAVAGILLPARAQNNLSFPARVTNASAQKIAFLLDPAHNQPPDDDFALWPGLPSLKDLSPQAAELFEPVPNSSYRLPNGILAVTAVQSNQVQGVNIWFPFSPNINVGPGTPIGSVVEAIKWLDQPNEPVQVSGRLWRFPKEIPEPFAQMLKEWDGKKPLIQEVDLEELNNINMSGNYMKNTDTSKYRLKSAVPLDMEFHTNLVATRKDAAPPQDHVRITAVRFLREGGRGMEAESPMSAYIDSPGDFWDPILVPEFSAGNDLVVLLPEDHDEDGVKATFFALHITVPPR